MRRLTACVIAIVVAWLVVSRLGPATGGSAALALGLTLLAAAIVGWLCEFVRLPRITGYLAIGLVCGPSVANIITEAMARDLQAASRFAVVVIAVVAGLHINFSRIRVRRNRLIALALSTTVVAWLAMGAALYFAWPWLPIAGDMTGLQRLAAVALTATLLLGTSPAVTIAVITEGRSRGVVSDLATELVVLLELTTVVLLVVCLELARVAFGVPERSAVTLLVGSAWSLLGSAAFGAMMGAAFALYLRYVGREVTVVLLALCVVLSGFAELSGFEPFLAGLAAGVVVQNVMAEAGDVLHDAIEYGAMPVLVLFFAAIGASIHVELIATVGVVALALSALRLVSLQAGTRVGDWIGGTTSSVTPLLWRALLPTAGVTLGLAAAVAVEHAVWGARVEALVIAVVAINQLAGPILFRAALAQAGEIGRAGGGLVVVSNREPWMHERDPATGAIVARPTPGGVSVALDALMRERGGVWIAHGAGDADRLVVDAHDSVEVPPEAPAYRLRRLWLTSTQVERYYAGFSNSALWPLCHQAHVRPQFREEDWEAYRQVNRLFADAVAVEAPPEASVFLNDYHLALAARDLRAQRPLLRSALFWHIPWPDVDRLRICPWRRDILEGLLSNDLLAFQVPRDTRNFLAAASEELGAAVSGDTAFYGDRAVRVVSIPIGADFDRISSILNEGQMGPDIARMAEQLGLTDRIVGIGVDRLDYTKGIPERIGAIGRLLRESPGLAERFTFVQIGVPSRADVPGYAEISAEIDDLVAQVNTEFGSGPDSGPIRYVKDTFQLPDLVALYRLADFCIVSSLHDGMNLVAKEFVAARDDLDGVLILSELAGAAHEMAEALIINPYDERGFTEAIARAIAMPEWERKRRMQTLRRQVAGRDVLAWASDILNRLERRKGIGFLSG
jgi:trehalose 6-phosphate synthase